MNNIYKFLLLILCTLAFRTSTVHAQYVYGNEWITPNQDYWKFFITENRIYKIDYNKLVELGLQNTPGSQFKLFNLGNEVPLYVTTNGTMTATDYILFEGKAKTMELDKQMYSDQNVVTEFIPVTHNGNPYFLTVAAGTNKRFTKVSNPVNPAQTPVTHFKIINSFRETATHTYSGGKSYSTTNYYPSSHYDVSEGYPASLSSTSTRTYSFNTTNKYNNDSLDLYVNFFNTASTNNNIRVTVNGNVIYDTTLAFSTAAKRYIKIPNATLANGGNSLQFTGSASFSINEIAINSSHINDFGLIDLRYGVAEIKNTQQYFSFQNIYFPNPVTAYFFDLNNLEFYESTAINTGNHNLNFNNTTLDKKFIILQSNQVVNLSTTITKRRLTNPFVALNKNYILLTDSSYINASPDYVNQFVSYRNSAAGGSYLATAIDVNLLYDLFAYGNLFHPLAIKNFIKYGLDTWQTKPTHLFIVGKGLQPHLYSTYLANATAYNFKPIPTWGYPGTDNLFSSYQNPSKTFPELATGRLSARTNTEIGAYLEKVRSYEEAVKLKPEILESLWKKEALHIAGGSDLNLQLSLINELNTAKSIIEDTLLNARVRTVYKRSTDPMTQNADKTIDSLIDRGLRYITFYGHASSSGFDYNLNSPEIQNSKPRFPIFSAYGCDVADIYLLTNTKTISENYLTSTTGGSIAMISSNNLGWTSVIPYHMQGLYREFANKSYFKSLGEQYNANIHFLNNTYSNPFYDIHSHSFLLQGDPGLLLGNPDKPDFAIEEQFVSINPANVNITSGSFKINAKYYNIGMATKDSFWVKLEHTKLSNNQLLFVDSFKTAIGLLDSLDREISLSSQAVGLTRVKITLDLKEEIDEIYESNNTVNIDVNIYEEDIVPIYPYEFAIVTTPTVTLNASTLNTFAASNKYILEFDTTELFNSPLKQSNQLTTIGGTVKWTPTGTLLDSTVYYWRTAIDTLINNERKWNYSSFIHIQNGFPGWSQSHIYQYQKDKFTGIELNNNRKFTFTPQTKNYTSTNLTVYNSNLSRQNEIHDDIDGNTLNIFSCWFGYNTIQIGIIDTLTGEALPQSVVCRAASMVTNNEFHVNSAATRNGAMQFIRNIPPGYYITVKTIVFEGNYNGATMSPVAWQADTAIYGSGNSLYHALKEKGFTEIDQTNTTQRKTILFFTKVGDPNYVPVQKVSQGDEKIFITAPMPIHLDHGKVESTTLGPAASWETLHWNVTSEDNLPQNDTSFIEIFGINSSNNSTLLYKGIAKDTSLSFIDAAVYPHIVLNWTSKDTINKTSEHLNYWRVHYQPLPEAALNPIKLFSLANDTLTYGENLSFQLAVENISDYDMDSMLVRYRVVDQNNVSHNLDNKRFKKLLVGDTINVGLDIDIRNFSGLNYLFIEANPFNDQPEMFHPNNIGAFPFYVNTDNRNPLLDVTFDGIRILDKDIVSAKPFIKILLNDENKNLLLRDTSLFELSLASPNNISNAVRVPIDGVTCKFFPAVDGTKNEAYLEYRPELLEDGIYKLIVKAKDNSNNQAGNFDKYEVNFTVDNTPGITHLLNYPNPFSTSTSFVFTLTGSQIPSQFKIQILSVTGKVVKEITKEELGPITIGRNITQYKWDGKDQYGQMLGNGVYLYRVITHINGEKLEHRANKNVDKYFKEGYGKMYIMR